MLRKQGGRSLKPLICWENNGKTPLAMLGTWAPFHSTVCVSIREGCWEFLLSKQLNNLTILGLGLLSSEALGLHCDTVYEVAGEGQKQKMAEENESLHDAALRAEFRKNNSVVMRIRASHTGNLLFRWWMSKLAKLIL